MDWITSSRSITSDKPKLSCGSERYFAKLTPAVPFFVATQSEYAVARTRTAIFNIADTRLCLLCRSRNALQLAVELHIAHVLHNWPD